MNEKKWERFFELISDIVNGEGSWNEKKAEVIAQAGPGNSDFSEFLNWFGGATSEDE